MQIFRLQFSKTGDARYLSHLDLNRCFTRALKRSGIDCWYTEGFHSHLYLMFALPLALGIESLCESVDVKAESAEDVFGMAERINPYLPRGIEVYNALLPRFRHAEIARARYYLTAEGSGAERLAYRDALLALMRLDSVEMDKKGKKGVRTVDIRKQIHGICCSFSEDRLIADVLADAGDSSSLNPALLHRAAERQAGRSFEWPRVTRMQILTGGMENFE